MSKPFDNTLNTLIDGTAGDWAAHFASVLSIPPGPLTDYDPVRDGNLSGTAFADKVFFVNGPKPAYIHLELQSWSELGVPERMDLYNTMLRRRKNVPVYSVLILLRRSAVASDQTGILIDTGVNGEKQGEFRYTVVRAWEQPADYWLNAGLGLAPLALLTEDAANDLPGVTERFHDRLRSAAVPDTLKRDVLGSAFVLGGLWCEQDRLVEVFTRMSATLEDSTTYQWILQKGIDRGRSLGEAVGEAQGEARWRAAEARQLLLRQGTRKFGEPDSAISERLTTITDVARLERIADRIFDATSWDDLLGTP